MLYHLTLSLHDFKTVFSFFPIDFTVHPSHKEDEAGSSLKPTDLFFLFFKHESMVFVAIIMQSLLLPEKQFLIMCHFEISNFKNFVFYLFLCRKASLQIAIPTKSKGLFRPIPNQVNSFVGALWELADQID